MHKQTKRAFLTAIFFIVTVPVAFLLHGVDLLYRGPETGSCFVLTMFLALASFAMVATFPAFD